MKRHPLDRQPNTDFGVGFPVGLIAILMLGISAYLVVLGVEIPPPQTAVFVPAQDLATR